MSLKKSKKCAVRDLLRRLWAKISALFGKKNEGSGINSDMRAVTTFTVYNQKVYEGENKLYIGEDALPYADGEVLLVADGLGGRGGYSHTKVDRNIVYRDGFYDLVFAPVFGDVEEGFKKYLLDSFTEIFETQDYYFTDRNAARTSGYFASRLAAAITVYELKYAESRKSVDELLSDTRGSETAIKEYAVRIADELRKKMSIIADNLSLVNESNVCGANLLPTTLHAALYKENAATVDVIYFWAGDSRAYAWDADGLAQVTAEHEKAEVMTNLVNLTEDFVIESRHVTFNKPCALFSVTDGCYKCGAFFTPLHFEWNFLKVIKDASDAADASEKLKRLFAEKGQHDDSNTMALAIFGYKDFVGFKKTVETRLGTIYSQLIEKLPGITETDYGSEINEARSEVEKIILPKGARWIEIPAVRMYLIERMRLEKDKKFLETEALFKSGEKVAAAVGAQTEATGVSPTKGNMDEGAAKNEKEACGTYETKSSDMFAGAGTVEEYTEKSVAAIVEATGKMPVKACEKESTENAADKENGNAIDTATSSDRIGLTASMAETAVTGENRCKQTHFCIREAFSVLRIWVYIREWFKKKRISVAKDTRFACVKDVDTCDDATKIANTAGVAPKEMTYVRMVAVGEVTGGVIIKAYPSDGTPAVASADTKESLPASVADGKASELELYESCINRYWRVKKNSVISDIWFGHREILPENIRKELEEDAGTAEQRYLESKSKDESRQRLMKNYNDGYMRFYKESQI